MAQNSHQLDERYTEGIWYDQMTGDFCEIRESEDGVGLHEPGRTDKEPYHVVEYEEWVAGVLPRGFRRVPENVVENPATRLHNALSEYLREASLHHAEIVEKEERQP